MFSLLITQNQNILGIIICPLFSLIFNFLKTNLRQNSVANPTHVCDKRPAIVANRRNGDQRIEGGWQEHWNAGEQVEILEPAPMGYIDAEQDQTQEKQQGHVDEHRHAGLEKDILDSQKKNPDDQIEGLPNVRESIVKGSQNRVINYTMASKIWSTA